MTSVQFAYWLQGLFELADPKALDEKQTSLIRQHLAMVFKHEIDPSAGSAAHQAELGALHEAQRPVTASDLEAAVKAAVEKIPKPVGPTSYGPGPVLRC